MVSRALTFAVFIYPSLCTYFEVYIPSKYIFYNQPLASTNI